MLSKNFYRFEYQLFPDDSDSLIAADVVVYKNAIKLYPEKSEPRVIRGWELNDKLWVVWNQRFVSMLVFEDFSLIAAIIYAFVFFLISHEVKITKSKLLRLFEYDFVLKIWDNKDFCSARTRFDKPRPFKFSKTSITKNH